ncbi:MAG: hypothetical protein P4L74_00555 [Candidatus Doudnabacteria bacterium]|nr:hypothetical protein [Candidatus Doudnabacteria bacterium]
MTRKLVKKWVDPDPFSISTEIDTARAVINNRAWLLSRKHETLSYIEVHAIVLSIKQRHLILIGRRDGEKETRAIPVKTLEILGTAPLLKQASRSLLWVNGLDYKPLTS